MVLAPAVDLEDGPNRLEVRARFEAPSAAPLELVRRGTLAGLSVEFHAIEEHDAGGVRVVSRAHLAA